MVDFLNSVADSTDQQVTTDPRWLIPVKPPPFAAEFFRSKGQAMVAFPQDGALAFIIDKDKGLLAGTSRGGDQMGFHAQPIKFCAMNHGRMVVSHFANIPGAQAPLLASNHRGRDLPARQDIRGMKLDFGAERGIARHRNERVGGIQPDADNIHLG